MAAVFDAYSKYYDLLYRDKDYAAEAEYVHGLLTRYFAPAGDGITTGGARSLLELGSGTGRHARLLNQHGYDVQGVERSDTMLARARSLEVPGTVSFQQGDVRDVRLGRTYDAAISLFHVMSYLPTNADWIAALSTARAHLRPGGLFVFDVWYGPAVLTDRPTVRVKRMADEDTEIVRLAEPTLHPNENLVDVAYTVFIRQRKTGRVEELGEVHRMRYVFRPEVEQLCDATGFEVVRAEEWMTGRPAGFDTWGLCFVARVRSDGVDRMPGARGADR